MTSEKRVCIAALTLVFIHAGGRAQFASSSPVDRTASFERLTAPDEPFPADSTRLNAFGVDVLISNDGFGLGTFYRREFTQDFSGFVSLSVSESKDDREVERIDPFTQVAFVPGKLNRFLVIPLQVGVQQRFFRDDILDTFRPYINIGAGPAMVFAAPFIEVTGTQSGLRYTPAVSAAVSRFGSLPSSDAT